MIRKSTLISFLIAIILAPCALSAQSTAAQRARWMEQIRKTKFEFFTKEVNLSKEQQNQLFPLYEEMEKTIYKMNSEAEALMKKTAADANASETEFEAAATAMAKTTLQQGEIELDYFNKFSKFLSKKQLFRLKQAEEKFTQYLLKQRRSK